MNLSVQFFSDLHIQRDDDPRAVLFESTLNKLVGKSSHLFLLGDVFDLWIADRPYFCKRYSRIIKALEAVRDSGSEIHVFEGNHDFHFGDFWEKQFGATVHQESWQTQLGAYQLRLEHGDLMNPNDKGYRLLRWFMRTLPLRAFAHSVSGEFIASFADPWSRRSRKRGMQKINAASAKIEGPSVTPISENDMKKLRADRIRAMMHAYALEITKAKHFDFIITGHTHIKDDYTFQTSGKATRFINLGSWFDDPQYFELTDTGGNWRNLNESI